MKRTKQERLQKITPFQGGKMKKSMIILLAVVIGFMFGLYAQIWSAQPDPGIDVGFGNFSAPSLTDIDSNNLLDLLVGNSNGTIYHYEQDFINAGTFTLVTSSFNAIDVGIDSTPAVTDIDGDNLLDLLIGESYGMIYHYEQDLLYSQTFSLVTTFFNSIDVGYYAVPTFTDLDGDNLIDLMIGTSSGIIYHYEQDALLSYTFNLISSYFNSIYIGNNAAPAFKDFDEDGLLDLLIGESDGLSGLTHYEQDSQYSLTFNFITTYFQSIGTGGQSKPLMYDIDGDNLMNLFVGNYFGNLYHYEEDPPLPVELSTFTAIYSNGSSLLEWTTQSESNNQGWNIYRSEAELEDAIQINATLINGTGTTTEPTEYEFTDEHELIVNNTYWYWLESIDYSGETEIYSPSSLTIPEPGDNPDIPEIISNIRNYPNPFYANTEIQFMIMEPANVEVSIYNLKGQQVIKLFNGYCAEEQFSVSWNGRDKNDNEVTAGMYFYKLEVNNKNYIKKMILLD